MRERMKQGARVSGRRRAKLKETPFPRLPLMPAHRMRRRRRNMAMKLMRRGKYASTKMRKDETRCVEVIIYMLRYNIRSVETGALEINMLQQR